ncbi:hypothetical protein GPA10_05020 [Streptomyces sp. p1417]|uniref:Uncharacterized protein n=1 Tax=Streptomyces typhae TaxID=2681492 RepID=A0A6L6WR31_9ACTN|nr:hypothetical protein [Streptomyces typhae]MVO84147.1 hypothetical protein [Streptomyces typhae]
MPWFALDDGFDTHPKVRKAGNAAIGLFVRLGVHATKHLTEGHLDGVIVRDYGTPATVRKLIAVGMLHEHGHACPRCPQPVEDGFVIHDYLDYNKSRAQIEAAREAARKRQNRGRESARRNREARDSAANLDGNSRENDASFAPNSRENAPRFEDSPAGHEGVSRRDTHEGATGVPSPPLPSQNYGVADVGGDSAGSGAHAPRPDGPSADLAPIDADGFTLTDAMRRWALQTFGPTVDIDHSTAQFVSHYRSTGARRRSWPDAWQKWIRDDAKRAAERANRPQQGAFLVPLPGGGQNPPPARRSTTDERVAGWLALASGDDTP